MTRLLCWLGVHAWRHHIVGAYEPRITRMCVRCGAEQWWVR